MEVIELEQNPCVVSYSKEFNVFIVGTYQLIDKSLDKDSGDNRDGENLDLVNHRIGSIYIISIDSQILKYHRCSNGGVFDIKIHYNQQTTTCCIYAAHSNGHAAIYEFDKSLDLKLTKDHRVEQSNLLTCIDSYRFKEGEVSEQEDAIIVGDDLGYVNIITCGISTCRLMSADHEGYSVWQVKVFYCNQSSFLITGSDDCSWRIYLFKGQLTLLKVIKEFQGGITSFFIKPTFEQNQIHIFVGSYDETLRQYSFVVQSKSDSEKVTDLEVNCINKMQIPGSGLWRIKDSVSEKKFMISGMYSGCFSVLCDLTSYEDIISPDIDKNCKEKPLFYDIDISECNKCCVVDFNNKRCYMLKRSK